MQPDGVTPHAGTTVAHYTLLERIGEGGLGEVYRARDTRIGRTVALKLPPADFAAGRREERLLQDIGRAAALSHPHVATLFEAGHHGGRLYLAYEFIQGGTLRQQMNGFPMSARHALDLAVQVAGALEEGHLHGVLHRDVRPDTILVTAKGSAKLLDFGLAAWTRGGQLRALAAAAPEAVDAGALSIVSYMSPEQARGNSGDARSDVFSLAVVVYEMLTGINPFAAADPAATLANIIRLTPSPPSTVNPELPDAVDAALSHALSKDVDVRTESAASLQAELRRCRELLDNLAEPRRASDRTSASQPADLLPIEEERGGSAIWWLLAALVIALGAALYFWMR